MTKIKIPGRLFHYDTEDKTIDWNSYLNQVINKVYEEIEECFESLRYTGDRNEFAACFNGQSTTFKKLSVLLKLLKYAEEIENTQKALEDVESGHSSFVCAADNLAYMFEDFKTKTRPTLSIRSALRFYKDYNLLYPRVLLHKETEVGYQEINRLIKIYLLKESFDNFSVRIKDGVAVLESEYFIFRMTLCGDIKNPEWKLFDINREHKASFLSSLPSDVSKLNFFVGLYSSLEKANEIYSMLTKDTFFKDLIKGSYTEFTLDYILKLEVKIIEGKLVGKCTYLESVKYFLGNIIKEYEIEIERILREVDRRAKFTIQKKISLRELYFNTLTELKEYLYEEKQINTFYGLFLDKKCIKNYKKEEFGPQNVFKGLKNSFFCISLREVKEVVGFTYLCLDAFSGKILEDDFLYYFQLFFSYRDCLTLSNIKEEQAKDSTQGRENLVLVKDFKNFLEKSADFIFIFADLLLYNNDFKIFLGREMVAVLNGSEFVITKENGKLRINDFIVENTESLLHFLDFQVVLKSLFEIPDLERSERNGLLYYRFNEIEFRLDFVKNLVVLSENKSFVKLMQRGSISNFLVNFYYLYLLNMYPEFICQEYVIFSFKMVFEDKVVLKVKSKDTFLVKKTYFTASNFKLPVFDHLHFICSAKNADFFRTLRSVYLKERFLILASALKKKFRADTKKFMITLALRNRLTIFLAEDKLFVKVDGQKADHSRYGAFPEIFYTEEGFVESFVNLISEFTE